jgi:transcriptional regulator with PAS, ATPase and Fis domain
LFESELFGYVKGAFTDAKSDKKGKLAKVNGGTVFFDEIGELPLSTQVKLLRLLQEREYEPLGSTETIKANIRVVAASNKDLKKLVAQAKFRDDLYFRLAVVKFELPALKNRREDIPFLVDHFIRKFNAKSGKKIISVSPNVMNILMRYDFPGNIRELENIIEHGFVLCRGSIIKREHLSPELLQTEHDSLIDAKPESTPVTESIDEQERIINALRNCGGVIIKAADELKIHRTTLWRKIKRYNIDINLI